MNDQLSICPKCSCDANYITQVTDTVSNQMCYGCGFYTSTALIKDTEFYNSQIEILPELYKDLSWEDPKTKEVWFPSTINMPDKGMIFANGKSKDEWKWAAVTAIDIPEEERFKFPIPNKKGEFYTRRMDMKTLKEFDKNDFIEALDHLGMFNENK